jgi:hypothetical protein
VAAALLLQVLPLPAVLGDVLSPHASAVRTSVALEVADAAWMPLTIDARQSAWAAAVALGALALFVAALTLVPLAGVRHVVRGITTAGLGCAVLAIAQAATAGRSIYWTVPTEYEGPLPFGPFVNRNHFATWMLMAAPVTVGYIAARMGRRDAAPNSAHHPRTRLAQVADSRMIWLTISGAVMIGSLLLSASRSGLFALTAAGIVMATVTTPRASPVRRRRVFALLVLMLALALWKADLPRLAERVGQTETGIRGRLRIWSDTLPMTRDFWLTGTGAGTYRTAMLVYQRVDRDQVQFNQAHNHYLQIATEGGLLLGLPVALAFAALAQLVAARLSADRSGIFWIRAGAACGLLAVALQSLWETGLVMPANAALAAVVAAIAVHDHASGDASS